MADKYQSGKIYKVVDNAYTSCYYGSTIEQLSKRMAKHRRDYSLYKEGKKPMVSIYKLFDEFDVANCKIELVELYPCSSKEELTRQEGKYIKENYCVNKKVEGRTLKEWYQDNRDAQLEKAKEYYNSNTETVKARQLTWRENNRATLNDKAKAYREEKKDIIFEAITCDICGGSFSRHHRVRHTKSLKHQAALQDE
jgi:hypothetical protein